MVLKKDKNDEISGTRASPVLLFPCAIQLLCETLLDMALA